jgi:hypothetical protein
MGGRRSDAGPQIPNWRSGAAEVAAIVRAIFGHTNAGRRAAGAALESPASGGFRVTNYRQPMSLKGRQCEYAALGCSRSAAILYRSMLATCEQLLSPLQSFSAA